MSASLWLLVGAALLLIIVSGIIGYTWAASRSRRMRGELVQCQQSLDKAISDLANSQETLKVAEKNLHQQALDASLLSFGADERWEGGCRAS